MMNQSEMYQAGYNDYMNGECNFPDDSEYMDGWTEGQMDAESEFENAMEAELELKAEMYYNEHFGYV